MIGKRNSVTKDYLKYGLIDITMKNEVVPQGNGTIRPH